MGKKFFSVCEIFGCQYVIVAQWPMKYKTDRELVLKCKRCGKREVKEVKNIFESVIEKAFDFTTDDSLVVDVDKLNYADNATERVHRWHQAIKYKVLEKYVSLVEDREKHSKLKIDSSKSKDTIKDNFIVKSDTELEADARAAIKKTYLKRFSQLEKTFDKEIAIKVKLDF